MATTGRGTSPVFIVRLIIVLLGVVVLGVGLHSHFQSDWSDGKDYLGNSGRGVHKICSIIEFSFWNLNCPDIAMEHFYVSMIIIFFVFSLVGLVTSFLTDMRSQPIKTFDLIYHILGTLLLLTAAILYIISAVQINQIKKKFVRLRGDLLVLRFEEKLVAGVLTALQAILYGMVTVLICRS